LAHVERLNERFKTENKAPVKLHAAPKDFEDEDLLEMVNAGLISTIVVDGNLAKLWSELLTKLQLHEEIIVNANGEFGWAVRQNTPKLLAAINDFAKTRRQGTTFGNTVIRRYTVSTERLKQATSSVAMQRFQQTAEIFRKYGHQYGMDYLLMMAQGFQESGLNQDAKSHVGAIVAFILASNDEAAILNVGIPPVGLSLCPAFPDVRACGRITTGNPDSGNSCRSWGSSGIYSQRQNRVSTLPWFG
jgi:membrane-bound lytic murein transglycosylase MltF